jgi:hypothetical protein
MRFIALALGIAFAAVTAVLAVSGAGLLALITGVEVMIATAIALGYGGDGRPGSDSPPLA